jgi:hypothetical protein
MSDEVLMDAEMIEVGPTRFGDRGELESLDFCGAGAAPKGR